MHDKMQFVCRSHEENNQNQHWNEDSFDLMQSKSVCLVREKIDVIARLKGEVPFRYVQNLAVNCCGLCHSNQMHLCTGTHKTLEFKYYVEPLCEIFVFRTHPNAIDIKCFAFIHHTIWNSNHYHLEMKWLRRCCCRCRCCFHCRFNCHSLIVCVVIVLVLK